MERGDIMSLKLKVTNQLCFFTLLGDGGDDRKAGYEHRRYSGILPASGEVAEETEPGCWGEGGLGT